jgi:hypothetical protein
VDPDTFAEQKPLADAAVAVFQSEDSPLTRDAIVAQSGLDAATFDRHFDRPEAALTAFYDLLVPQYRLITASTEGFETFSLEERLGAFHFILLDGLGEQRAFVQATFDSAVRRRSTFRADVRAVHRALFTSADVPNANRLVTGWWPVHEVMTEISFALFRSWIRDDSPDQQTTTALVDKLVAFVAELVTFGGVQRGVDLAWYVVQADLLGLKRLPLIGRWFG